MFEVHRLLRKRFISSQHVLRLSKAACMLTKMASAQHKPAQASPPAAVGCLPSASPRRGGREGQQRRGYLRADHGNIEFGVFFPLFKKLAQASEHFRNDTFWLALTSSGCSSVCSSIFLQPNSYSFGFCMYLFLLLLIVFCCCCSFCF